MSKKEKIVAWIVVVVAVVFAFLTWKKTPKIIIPDSPSSPNTDYVTDYQNKYAHIPSNGKE